MFTLSMKLRHIANTKKVETGEGDGEEQATVGEGTGI
jgi:hypothetical protein